MFEFKFFGDMCKFRDINGTGCSLIFAVQLANQKYKFKNKRNQIMISLSFTAKYFYNEIFEVLKIKLINLMKIIII